MFALIALVGDVVGIVVVAMGTCLWEVEEWNGKDQTN